ncbi:hypothetical protein M409DRAFT_19393 [Zasmidium cellare ATCC 36951]|uniref:C2H2-type domain-containing protein n=1 Tax=Zasmidium cellare ATCC 36951 TaxID=1080233 RepID=A0A6A6CU58_ZASCE|nr:uncharacterized protein M409DRAFT_19393 [Zasmidium cellare ATCC 36951]KAF2170575.1 hypothetical protein M409DRAFT_19393 [Zasmidium cellare ATCC 36951]
MRVDQLVTPDDSTAAPPPKDDRAAPRHEPAPAPPVTKHTNHHTHVFQLSGADPRGDRNGSKAFAHQPVHFGAYRSYTGPGAPPGPPPHSPSQYQGTQYTFQSIQNPPQHTYQFQQQNPAASPVIRRRRPQSARSLDSPDSPAKPAKRASTGQMPPANTFPSQDTNGANTTTDSSNVANGSTPNNNNVACSVVPGNRSFPCPLSIYGCTSTFGSKNEWKRHVNTQHMRMGFWRCDMCKNGDRKPNDFNRKDLFIQHVRRMHPLSATSPATAGLPAPSKSSKDGEDMQLLQTAAARCYKALRHPPEESCCLFCDRTFSGEGTWDDRMEHVGRHLELIRRANDQPPESKDWRADQPMEKWLASYQVIVPNGDGWILDDQQLTQKPPRRASSIAQLPKPVFQTGPHQGSPVAPQYAPATAPVSAAAPPSAPAPALPPLRVVPTPAKYQQAPAQPIQPIQPVQPVQPVQQQVQPAPPAQVQPAPPQAAPAPPKAEPLLQIKRVQPPAPAAAQPQSTPRGRQSSPDRLFSAFDEPGEQPVKSEQSSSASTSPGTNADSQAQTTGTDVTEATEIAVKPKVSTRSKGKRNAAKEQAEGGAEDEDPYLSLFQTIPKRKKGTAAGDDDDEEEAEPESFEDSNTIAGGSQRTSRKRQASPAPSSNSFCGSLKDRIYSGFQKAVLGMATSVSRLFVEPTDGQPGGVQRSTPVAKRTRTARAQEKAVNGEDDDETFEPVRKRQRRGRKDRGDSALRESSTSSLSMSTRSSGRVKDSVIEKGVISSRS